MTFDSPLTAKTSRQRSLVPTEKFDTPINQVRCVDASGEVTIVEDGDEDQVTARYSGMFITPLGRVLSVRHLED